MICVYRIVLFHLLHESCFSPVYLKLPVTLKAAKHTLLTLLYSIFKNERVCRGIYQNRKSTGTRWLWQQNEIPPPHNNRT